MCYTSGTTGQPKGVVYSHRSTYLHSLAQTAANSIGLRESDRALVIVPMFHANAWGTPYSAWMSGSDLIMPQHVLQGGRVSKIIPDLRPTVAAGVPTIWNDLLQVAKTTRDRHLLAPGDHRRGLGRAPQPHRGLRGHASACDDPGLGHDRDQPARRRSPCRRPARTLRRDRLPGQGRALVAGSRSAWPPRTTPILPNDGESVGEFEVRGPLDHRLVLRRRRPGQLPRRLAAHRRRRHPRRRGIHDHQRPHQGRHQVWWRVDLLGGARGRGDGPPRGLRGSRHRRARRRWQERPLVCVVLSPGEQARPRSCRVPRRARRQVVAARALVLPRGRPEDHVGKFDKKVLRARTPQASSRSSRSSRRARREPEPRAGRRPVSRARAGRGAPLRPALDLLHEALGDADPEASPAARSAKVSPGLDAPSRRPARCSARSSATSITRAERSLRRRPGR